MATTANRGYELQLTGSNRGRWGVILNSILSKIDSNISEIVEIDCTGSLDITVLDSEASNIFQKLTGVLTGDIEVIYPDKGAFFMVDNSTTGNFTLKVVNVSGGVGVTIAQGDVALVYTDAASNEVILIDNGLTNTVASMIATLKSEIDTVYVPTVGGTANAITLTPTTPITDYANGQRFRFIIAATNTAAVVNVNVSGEGNIPIKKTIGGALVNLAVGDLPIGTIADIEKIGSDFQLLNIRPHSHGADVASAATIDLDAATGDYVYITGTTTITAVTLAEGKNVLCKFSGIVTITNGASLICPGAANVVTIADQVIEFIGEAGGVVRVRTFASSAQGEKADTALQPGISVSMPTVTTTSGTSQDFLSIPSGVHKITVSLDGVSVNGADNLLLQLGDSGGVEATGYSSICASITTNTNSTPSTAGFLLTRASAANATLSGNLTLSLVDAATNTWAVSGSFIDLGSGQIFYVLAGRKSLTATLDRVRLTTTGGANTFDAGLASVIYEKSA